MKSTDQTRAPLGSLDEWEDFLKQRYPEPSSDTRKVASAKPFASTDPDKKAEEFRDYRSGARASVKEFYRLNHTYQTREFVLAKQREFANRGRA